MNSPLSYDFVTFETVSLKVLLSLAGQLVGLAGADGQPDIILRYIGVIRGVNGALPHLTL